MNIKASQFFYDQRCTILVERPHGQFVQNYFQLRPAAFSKNIQKIFLIYTLEKMALPTLSRVMQRIKNNINKF